MPVSTAQLTIQHQYRRGPSSAITAFVGFAGEVVVDTSNYRAVVCDGVSTGGWPLSRANYTGVADSTYTVLATDNVVFYTTLTAGRAVSLPSAAAYATGQMLTIVDGTGTANVNNLTVSAATSTVSQQIGASTSFTINTAWGHLTLMSNGSSQWTFI